MEYPRDNRPGRIQAIEPTPSRISVVRRVFFAAIALKHTVAVYSC
jgi:hypothetical protein